MNGSLAPRSLRRRSRHGPFPHPRPILSLRLFLSLSLLLCLFSPSCSRVDLDLDAATIYGLKLVAETSSDDAIHVLGPPDAQTTSKRWLWRPPRLYLKYYEKGLEMTFDSEGRTYDPISSRFVRAYVFLRPEHRYRVFQGRVSHGVTARWDLGRLERAMGPPVKTRKVGDELEWVYGADKAFQTIFIAEAGSRTLKAVMFLRADRERPL